METAEVREKALWGREAVSRIKAELGKVIVGHDDIVEGILICMVNEGHALLEGVPGLGKTTLIKCLAQILDLKASRIQFTPDLMPADIVGTNVLMQDDENRTLVRFQSGPVFANIVLADEINRATPKTQSALLEAMQERTVTAGGTTYALEPPFVVLATQNPIEMEGTYPLPEAQLDRFFFKLNLDYPSASDIASIIDRTTARRQPELSKVADGKTVLELSVLVREVPVAAHVSDYAIRLALATRPGTSGATELVNRYVRYGASPRGPQALVLGAKAKALFDGRLAAGFSDVRAVSLQSLRHRILLNFEGEAEGITAERIIQDVLEKVPEIPAHLGGAGAPPSREKAT
jgi:MoxR-like ATPase